jgi:hypothetical protein
LRRLQPLLHMRPRDLWQLYMIEAAWCLRPGVLASSRTGGA